MLKHILESCKPSFKLSSFDSIELVNKRDWNALTAKGPLYLTMEYLQALESNVKGINFRYVIAYDMALKPILAAYFQIIEFKLTEGYTSWLKQKFGSRLTQAVLQNLEIKLMVCGNLFACGDFGFVNHPDISRKDAFDILNELIKRVLKNGDGKAQNKVNASLIKEIHSSDLENASGLLDHKFTAFRIDHQMVLPVHPTWKTMDDYYSSITSKFRTRARSALRKSRDLRTETLNQGSLEHYKHEIYKLYTAVLENAEFNLGELGIDALPSFKKHLGERFVIKGYFKEEKLIGFSAFFQRENILDAAFVGMDYAYAVEFALYQRILLDFIEEGISRHCIQICFGRTAEQAKSSVGALPVEMHLLLKHKSHVPNKLLKTVIEQIKPSDFEQRSPFKTEFSEGWIH